MGSDRGPIGILDSGVGGLTVLKEIIKQLPAEDIVYFGDTLHLPYGPRELKQVRGFVVKIVDFLLLEKGCKAIVVACNTATSAALNMVQKEYSVPVFGTITSAIDKALQITVSNKIGIIGTKGTIKSGVYQQALKQKRQQVKILARACPRFVELVETGNFSGDIVDVVIDEYLGDLKSEGIDSLILGCTHFPYLIPSLEGFLGSKITLISSAVEMAAQVKAELKQEQILKEEGASAALRQQEFIISDSSRISNLFLVRGSKFLNLPELNFTEQNIFSERGSVR